MGGKGGTAPPTATVAAPDNSAAMIGMMMQMMEMNNAQQMPMMPQMAPPEVDTTTEVDWASQMEDLENKVRYDTEAEDRKGRISTLHTSLTDEGEDTEMSDSLLGTE